MFSYHDPSTTGLTQVPIDLPQHATAAAFASFVRAVYALAYDEPAASPDPARESVVSLAQEFGVVMPPNPAARQSELDVAQLKLMTDDQFKDVTLVVGGDKIRAHKYLLMARSKYLHTMFTRYDEFAQFVMVPHPYR